MSTNMNVTVLAPNGHRQNVKVTPNTTILQIIEAVCKKHGFKVDDYDLKHYNKVLDSNMIFRFTGLPNNAQLEMITCTKERKVCDVTIGLQLENGQRLTGSFSPATTLLQIVQNLCPGENLETTLIIYMHREVHGQKALEETTLKLLGLSSGRAMLRLIHRDPTLLKDQAHISTPLISKSQKDPDEPANKSNTGHRSSGAPYLNKILDPVTLMKKNKAKLEESIKQKQTDTRKIERMEVTEDYEEPHCSSMGESKAGASHSNQPAGTKLITQEMEEDLNIQFLGERNALIFNQAGAKALPRDELPDNFFDVTIDDAKILLRDAMREREKLEDAPLLTDTQRQLEKDKKTLNQLHKYQQTIVRIQFPDQYVLQGLFRPLETVQDLKNFIKEYLEDPNSEFTIYTAPPKYILNPESRLLDENLVPSAIVYYSGGSLIKPSVKEKLTDPRAAGIQAIKSRMAVIRQDSVVEKSENDTPNEDSNTMQDACTSKVTSNN